MHDRVCTIGGCEMRERARGWCLKHYTRWYKHGDPGVVNKPSETERFDALYEPEPNTGCWIWLGSLTGQGRRYGSFCRYPNRRMYAHRAAYEMFVEPIVDGMEIDHLCKVTVCVNPDHLEQVTPRENWLRGSSPPRLQMQQTNCINGHPLSGQNLYVWHGPNGNQRSCRTCRRLAIKRLEAKQLAQADAQVSPPNWWVYR